MRRRGVAHPARFAVALLCLGAASLGLGCGRVRDTRACRSAAALVNPGLAEIEALNLRADVANPRKIADRYDELARKLAAIVEVSSALDAALKEYGGVLREAGMQVRKHADASEHADAAKLIEARRELERLRVREKSAILRLRVECRG